LNSEQVETNYSNSEEKTIKIGKTLGQSLQPPQIILLYGELGSGKTTFTRGLTEGLGVIDSTLVHSPSFTLVNEYPTQNGIFYHIDLYRLENQRDLDSIGLEEILSSHSIIIVEWPEKLSPEPSDALTVNISVDLDTQTRYFEIRKSNPSVD
jgi:tRNA threonylcarbamoyladenosine biosynthesis protein TsaE